MSLDSWVRALHCKEEGYLQMFSQEASIEAEISEYDVFAIMLIETQMPDVPQ